MRMEEGGSMKGTKSGGEDTGKLIVKYEIVFQKGRY